MEEQQDDHSFFCGCSCWCKMENTPTNTLEMAEPVPEVKRKALKRMYVKMSRKGDGSMSVVKRLFGSPPRTVENDHAEPNMNKRGSPEGSLSTTQQATTIIEECCRSDTPGLIWPLHDSVDRYFELGILQEDYVNPKNRRSAMNEVVKAVSYSILNHCFSEIMFFKCTGCVEDIPAQLGHDCLTWEEDFYNQNLKYVSTKLSMGPMLYTITLLATSIHCFTMNEGHIKRLGRYIEAIQNAKNAQDALNGLLKQCKQRYVDLAMKIIRKKFTHHNSLLNYCGICAPVLEIRM
ncbi:uncharacterized protein LOC129346486 [Eublepharis macularius]|uniref:Uncharacterized protein LOC129332414 n=2 Tax=Eublepharis macularius TaxID=481883 RepID=A0AA97L3Y7_EUBMA|nr:uncharacterized protein LOC129332414 [Eublepharis macularius]XP_054841336.1 uncharacterized protein LOC129333589 [Eublepharis macularius]XP_054841655.1 uncharacterized protein LOC129333794 [Eublepharis macularius]XP_054843282.1 uncharacterized protein LOC129334926 [Eublepharis macularius]XP_054852888.1 uncharacterized protein LOC129341634 [Eublepharis macularius]XP_054859809.1 uncharacterized protein LOC129346486 [Eublepharis macularius]